MRKILERCPTCGADLVVTEMRCTQCNTVISGSWEPCRFCRLDPETLDFIEGFVKNRGNLKEMERELGESYWTLRARLNEVIEQLGLETETVRENEAVASRRKEILAQVQTGAIKVTEAARQLAALKGNGEETP